MSSSYPGALWSPQDDIPVENKPTGAYTTQDSDFGKYIRVDGAVTLHAVDATKIGEVIWVRNTDALLGVAIAGDVGVTVNGAGSIPVNGLGLAIVVAENEYDLSIL